MTELIKFFTQQSPFIAIAMMALAIAILASYAVVRIVLLLSKKED